MVAALSPSVAKAAFILSSTRSGKPMMLLDARSSGATSGTLFVGGAPVLVASGLTGMGHPATDASAVDLDFTTPISTSVDTADFIGRKLKKHPIHFCFIVHGHKGRASDLSYLHKAVREEAKKHHAFSHVESSGKCAVGATLADANVVAGAENCASHDCTNDKLLRRRNKRDRLSLPLKLKASSCSSGDCEDVRLRNKDDSKNHVSVEKNALDRKQGNTSSAFIVHNALCNEGRTHDGVVNGGERLADEILDVIRYEIEKKLQQNDSLKNVEDEPIDVTISIIGNSLGGLYGRFAVARLAEIAKESMSQCNCDRDETQSDRTDFYCIKSGSTAIRIHFNVFCTTASPHLGCASHTYFPIPRAAEIGVAYGLGETGRDLFRLNDLLHEMATSPRFLEPLSRFRKRIAYANAFGTDFVVPTTTAAFLDKESDSLHFFENSFDVQTIDQIKNNEATTTSNEAPAIDNPNSDESCPASELGLVVATCHTRRVSMDEPLKSNTLANELTVMSSSLDSLGWKKIFIDMRREIPLGISIPIGSEPSQACPVQRLKSASQVVESRDLANALSRNPTRSTITLPLGHNAICAMSRGTVTSALNGGGKPVMDSLAIQLTNDISSWQQNNTDLN
ncbi:hypothetical protein HJC23_008596 [Cyclotella cryptica]|uniref:DUF676 domain-containing protein n=1 Tax=Cyclotella cryptica TaxID=29204 RepID=A0ABD3Q988_9STRA|eukprot:CCRYP_007955-RA/>CCRYP_007955-RA protein AED:0.01 eAED:0.01 QI:131/1/1/1/1/1/2/1499/622